MKNTHTTAGQTAQATQAEGAKVAQLAEKFAQLTGAEAVDAITATGKTTKAEAKKLRNALYKEVEARANMVAKAIDEDRATASAMLRDLFAYATGVQPIAENIRHALCADIKAVSGKAVEEYATAREFSRAWLDIVRKYATAQDDKTGEAVTIHAVAGMVEAVAFRCNIRTLYTDIMRNWVRNLSPLRFRAGVWYERKGRNLTAIPKAEARQRLDAYEERKAIAQAGAKAGRAEALRKYEGAKAIENA